MAKPPDYAPVFDRLRALLAKYERQLVVLEDNAGLYTLATNKQDAKGRPVYFGCVRAGKSYVSYHLIPIYGDAKLLDGISDELRGRMQGKTCFNFKVVDEGLFKELAALTKRCFDGYKTAGLI
jgi:hypothetical protein